MAFPKTCWGNLFSSVKPERIIVKNFLLLTLVSLLSALMFFVFVDGIYKQHEEKNLRASYVNMLVKTGDSVNSHLVNLAQMMKVAMRSKVFISATLAPDPQNFERNRDLIASLIVSASGSELIKNAYYYIASSDYLYSSRGMMAKLQGFEYEKTIRSYLRGSPVRRGEFAYLPKTSILYEKGSVFLLQDFFTVKRMGLMFFQLDLEKLYLSIKAREDIFKGSVHIYDSDLEPVFPHVAYPNIPKGELSEALREMRDNGLRIGRTSYYGYLDPDNRWLYLLSPPKNLGFGRRLALGVIVPFLFFFLMINLSAHFYSTFSIYRPVNEIMSSIVNQSDAALFAEKRAKNEFDFIKNAYDYIVMENMHYGEMAKQLAASVQERLFFNILCRREVDSSHVTETLNLIHSPFALAHAFMTLVARLGDNSALGKNEVARDFARIEFRKAIASIQPEASHHFWLLDKNDDLVMVVGFEQPPSQIRLKQFITAVDTSAREYGMKNPFSVSWGHGSVYSNVPDIRYSYAEALTNLRERRYADLDETDASARISEGKTFAKHLRHVWQHILDGETVHAYGLFTRIIEEMGSASDGGPPGTKEDRVKLTDLCVEKLVELQITGENLGGIEKAMADIEKEEYSLPSMQRFGELCISIIDQHNRKRQNKYIVGAMEFISEHYSDSDLSLSGVSEHLGIHSSYLSRLFNESMGKNFTTVLNEHRIETARQLLRVSKLSITEIGFKTGFNSAQNFIRVFKKHIGVTPGQYRERNS